MDAPLLQSSIDLALGDFGAHHMAVGQIGGVLRSAIKASCAAIWAGASGRPQERQSSRDAARTGG